MSKPIESQGKTVEEAVSEALLQLGARKDEVEVKVIDEGRSGFLGIIGAKPARVLVRRKEHSRGRRGGSSRGRSEKSPRRGESLTGDRSKSSSRSGSSKTKAGRVETRPGGNQRSGNRSGEARGERNRSHTGSRRAEAPRRQDSRPSQRRSPSREPSGNVRPPVSEAAPRRTQHEEAVPIGDAVKAASKWAPLTNVTPENSHERLEEITADLMRLSGFPCRCEVQQGEYHLVKLITDDSSAGVLIGRHGSTVDAIEHLVERMTSQACGERVNMNLDVNNYRRRREENLVQRVHEIMARVSSTGREVHLEPMCARERRIAHLEVINTPGLRTYTMSTSSGKQVVIAKGEAGASPGAPVDTAEETAAIDDDRVGHAEDTTQPAEDPDFNQRDGGSSTTGY